MPATIKERLYKGYAQVMEVAGKPLAAEKTRYQRVEIFDTVANGRVMTLDGIVQITTRDESAYAEMLTHLPMLEHGAVERVMIVGGGDLSIADEVLKHRGVKEVVLVDIDSRVVELCKQHFTAINAKAHRDRRLTIEIAAHGRLRRWNALRLGAGACRSRHRRIELDSRWANSRPVDSGLYRPLRRLGDGGARSFRRPHGEDLGLLRLGWMGRTRLHEGFVIGDLSGLDGLDAIDQMLHGLLHRIEGFGRQRVALALFADEGIEHPGQLDEAGIADHALDCR